MKKKLFLVIIAFLVIACGTSESVIQTAIAQTQVQGTAVPAATAIAQTQVQGTAVPTAIATSVPLYGLQMDNLLIQPNDLPPGLSGSEISNKEGNLDLPYSSGSDNAPGGTYGNIIVADYFIQQDMTYQDEKRGDVKVWVYDDPAYAAARFLDRMSLLEFACSKTNNGCSTHYMGTSVAMPVVVYNLGDSAMVLTVSLDQGPDAHTVVFQRCNAVVEVDIWSVTDEIDSVVNYAHNLDKRLSPLLVCP
jgi:hypothetical protein